MTELYITSVPAIVEGQTGLYVNNKLHVHYKHTMYMYIQ